MNIAVFLHHLETLWAFKNTIAALKKCCFLFTFIAEIQPTRQKIKSYPPLLSGVFIRLKDLAHNYHLCCAHTTVLNLQCV